MAIDSKKGRGSINDIRRDRTILNRKSDVIKGVGEKLVMDSNQVDAIKTFVESLDMPTNDKTRTIAYLDQQKQEIGKTFGTDVEKPNRELEGEQEELVRETAEYADNAGQNKEKLGNFQRESEVNDSPVKQAYKEQARYETEYRNEQKSIQDGIKSQENDIAELKRRAVGS
jgi:hypothetical protein